MVKRDGQADIVPRGGCAGGEKRDFLPWGGGSLGHELALWQSRHSPFTLSRPRRHRPQWSCLPLWPVRIHSPPNFAGAILHSMRDQEIKL